MCSTVHGVAIVRNVESNDFFREFPSISLSPFSSLLSNSVSYAISRWFKRYKNGELPSDDKCIYKTTICKATIYPQLSLGPWELHY